MNQMPTNEERREVAAAHQMIGHHRFDEHCPDRVDDWCYACRARKSQKI